MLDSCHVIHGCLPPLRTGTQTHSQREGCVQQSNSFCVCCLYNWRVVQNINMLESRWINTPLPSAVYLTSRDLGMRWGESINSSDCLLANPSPLASSCAGCRYTMQFSLLRVKILAHFCQKFVTDASSIAQPGLGLSELLVPILYTLFERQIQSVVVGLSLDRLYVPVGKTVLNPHTRDGQQHHGQPSHRFPSPLQLNRAQWRRCRHRQSRYGRAIASFGMLPL